MENTDHASDKLPECPIASPSSPSWSDYFDTRRSVSCPSRKATFNVYLAGTTGPVVLCLHGGGYTGLTWALLALSLKDMCQIVAPDLRGHGLTLSEDDLDLSAETLAADVAELWNELFCTEKSSEMSKIVHDEELEVSASTLPPTLIVGHSMGGAIAVHTASLNKTLYKTKNNENNAHNDTLNVSRYIPTLEGIVVIDVVEGTALSSLPFMKTVLQKRPGSFPDPSAAVEWALETGFSRNPEAAAISVPAMLKKRGSSGASIDGNLEADVVVAAKQAAVAAANAAWNINTTGNSRKLCTSAASELEPITEQSQEPDKEQQEQQSLAPLSPSPPPLVNNTGRPPRPSSSSSSQKFLKTSFGTTGAWIWRTPLEESSSYWEGWYRGLSTLYLNLKIPKMLILAGTDRLDRELTIGQMQGKFQLVLLSRAGHAVHEDEAGEVSAAVRGFIQRFKIGQVDKSLGVPGLNVSSTGGSLFRVPEDKAPKNEGNGNGVGFSRFKPPPEAAQD